MIYYGIVDKIKPEHKSGVYGNKKLDKVDWISLSNELIESEFAPKNILDGLLRPMNVMGGLVYKLYKGYKNKSYELDLVKPLRSKDRQIIIDSRAFSSDFAIDLSSSIFYGLFDDINKRNELFKKIMQSKGGSTLIIKERNSLPKKMHFGGPNGKFDTGIYCAHPKDENLLLPLKGSRELLSNLILEETIRAYEALGAKSIVIEDVTGAKGNIGGSKGKFSFKLSSDFKHKVSRKKNYHKGVFDPDRALKGSQFIHDYPKIMSVIHGRIHGNQKMDNIVEDVNLSLGLDVGVLNLFNGSAGFNYNRSWSFDVEFYDKNEILNNSNKTFA